MPKRFAIGSQETGAILSLFFSLVKNLDQLFLSSKRTSFLESQLQNSNDLMIF